MPVPERKLKARPRKLASAMSMPLPGSTVKLKPPPVSTRTPLTPSAFPSASTKGVAPATCEGSPMIESSSSFFQFLPR